MKQSWFVVVVVCLASICWGQDSFPTMIASKISQTKGPVVVGLFDRVADRNPAPMASGLWMIEYLDQTSQRQIFTIEVNEQGQLSGTYRDDDASQCDIKGFAKTDMTGKNRIVRFGISCGSGYHSFFGTLTQDGTEILPGNYAFLPGGKLQNATTGRFKAHLLGKG